MSTRSRITVRPRFAKRSEAMGGGGPAGSAGGAGGKAPRGIDGPIVRRAIRDALGKLDPRRMIRNPVMFVVEIGSAFTTILSGLGLA